MNVITRIPHAASPLAIVPRILIADDDPSGRKILADYLDDHGMRVSVADSRIALVDHLARHPSLIILGLHLGPDDGLDLLREVRGVSDVPVILVSSHRRDEIDRVVGLELGADDYITKPFGLREMLARVRSVLRRRIIAPAPAVPRARGVVEFGPWRLDRQARLLQRDGQAPIALTKGEYALLHAFVDAPGRPLTREHLLRATRVHEDVFDRSIDVLVLRLRRKLQDGVLGPRIIETVRGVGYVLTTPVETCR